MTSALLTSARVCGPLGCRGARAGLPAARAATIGAVLGLLDHVGYLARDFERSVAEVSQRLAMPVVRRFERVQFSLLGAYLGDGEGDIEVFTFTDPEAAARERLPAGDLVLDHVAYSTPDIHAVAEGLRAQGVRFTGPDLRGGAHRGRPTSAASCHLWTLPSTCGGQAIQLLQRASGGSGCESGLGGSQPEPPEAPRRGSACAALGVDWCQSEASASSSSLTACSGAGRVPRSGEDQRALDRRQHEHRPALGRPASHAARGEARRAARPASCRMPRRRLRGAARSRWPPRARPSRSGSRRCSRTPRRPAASASTSAASASPRSSLRRRASPRSRVAALPRALHRGDRELLLAAGEVEVQRALRRAAARDDLVQAASPRSPGGAAARPWRDRNASREAPAVAASSTRASAIALTISTGLSATKERQSDAAAHLHRPRQARVARSADAARWTPTRRRSCARWPSPRATSMR